MKHLGLTADKMPSDEVLLEIVMSRLGSEVARQLRIGIMYEARARMEAAEEQKQKQKQTPKTEENAHGGRESATRS
jgi:hypothetical protein